jgi:hypothetical protein
MKKVIRIILTFLSFVASYYFIFWVPFSLIPGAHNIPAIPIIVSLLIALTIGFFVWKQTGTISNGLSKYIIMGGLITGSIGFIIGFFGPIIFSPSSTQGPLLGIFITGPIGFLIGLIGGGIYWRIKVKIIE